MENFRFQSVIYLQKQKAKKGWGRNQMGRRQGKMPTKERGFI
jgi:hypothetical protein